MIWTKSVREEILAALWFIVAMFAKIAGDQVLAFACVIYACVCSVCSFCYAITEKEDQP